MTIGIWLVARLDRGFAASHDHVDGKLNQFSRTGREVVYLPGGVALLQQVVAALDISEIAHAKHELAA
jgi:hypothetical protein